MLASSTTGTTAETESKDFITFPVTVNSIYPKIGSKSGGHLVTITGSGFVDVAKVNCGDQLWEIVDFNFNSIKTRTRIGTKPCKLEIEQFSETIKTDLVYGFSTETTSVIESISPNTGGTGGGTLITISGQKLEKVDDIDIDGSPCLIKEKSKAVLISIRFTVKKVTSFI